MIQCFILLVLSYLSSEDPWPHHWCTQWLRVPQCIQYKLAVLTYKGRLIRQNWRRTGGAPSYRRPVVRVAVLLTCLVDEHSVLLDPTVLLCHESNCLHSAVEPLYCSCRCRCRCRWSTAEWRHFTCFAVDLLGVNSDITCSGSPIPMSFYNCFV